MTLSLSTLQKGSKVRFRCGGEAVVDRTEDGRGCVRVYFAGYGAFSVFLYDGNFYMTPNHPFDIIAIEPPEFDWSEVKPGMAFRLDSIINKELYYIGPDPSNKEFIICGEMEEGDPAPELVVFSYFLPSQLTRLPEKDIKL
jgi:hypothetical protein